MSNKISTNEALNQKILNVAKYSSFRFIDGKSTSAFDDLKNQNINVQNESNGFQCNEKFFSFGLSGSGGRIGIWPTSRTGRFPVKIPSFICGAELCDFKFDPFDHFRVCSATDDGKIRIWKIPTDDDISEDGCTPQHSWNAHQNRVVLLQFHPFAKDILLSASPEQGNPCVKLWDINEQKLIATFHHPDNILSACFSTDGAKIATTCRDKIIRVFDARSGESLYSGTSHEGFKASRVFWTKNALCTVGFGKANSREIRVHNLNDYNFISSIAMGTSPSVIVPHYDIDTGLIALVGRGDSFIQFYEIDENYNPVAVNRYNGTQGQQGVHFLPKRFCNVRNVEILTGYRITTTCIEKISFTVPRLSKEYFQDDIYPTTIDIETPRATSTEWINNSTIRQPIMHDMRPVDMIPLSQKPVVSVEKKSIKQINQASENELKEAAFKKMYENAQNQTSELEQDKLEGVDPDEWD